MSSSVRWRVMVLQAVALFALVFGAGFALWVSSFTHDTIRDQLTAQKIFFPPAGSSALSASFPTCSNTRASKWILGTRRRPMQTASSVGT